jgi:hypothetical protein
MGTMSTLVIPDFGLFKSYRCYDGDEIVLRDLTSINH